MCRRVGVSALLLTCACGSAVPGGGLPGWFGLRATGSHSAALGIGSSADDLRSGWYSTQPALHPAEVSSSSFQQLFDVALDGQIYAQPLLFSGGLLVVTENNHVYVLDPATGAKIVDRTLGAPWNPADLPGGCGDLAPKVGITGTPVIDPSTNTAYFTTKSYVSGTSGPAASYFQALDLSTLADRPGFPVPIQGSADNNPGVTFNPTMQHQRPGLVMINGSVYAGFGSHCGITPYKGWVFGVSSTGQIEARWSTEDQFNDGAGVWQTGGAPVSDGPNTFIISTGNGESTDVPTPGNTPSNLLGESWVRLVVQGNGTLTATDFFSPRDAPALNAMDGDFGSGGPMGLPDSMGNATVPHLGIGAGKQGYMYLLDRDDLGGFRQGPGASDKVVQRLGPIGGVWSRSAAWPGEGGWTYLPTASPGNSASGSSGQFHAFALGTDGTGVPALALAGQADGDFGMGSSPPVVTSDGTTPGSALVWVIWEATSNGANGELRVYDTRPVDGVLPMRRSFPIGRAPKFNPVGVGDGRIYVGNRDGHVLGFGNTTPVGLSGPAVGLGSVDVGSSASASFQFTASQSLTVSAVASSAGEFTVTNVSPPLPATLAPGATLSGTVTFRPASTGLRTGAVVATAGSGTFALSVSGVGQLSGPHLVADPDVVTFEPTKVGSETVHAVTLHNVGDAPYPVDSVSIAGAPFALAGAPPGATAIGPGQSMTLTVTFKPTAEGGFQDNLAVASSAGEVDVPLTGATVNAGRFDVNPLQLDFGTVQVGQSVTKSFNLSNGGGQRLTITLSKPPAAGVGFTGSDLQEGTSLAPDESMDVNVTFAPVVNGDVSDHWRLNADGDQGVQNVIFVGTGAGGQNPPDAGSGSDAGTGGGPPAAADDMGGCTSAAGPVLWPLLVLVGWMLLPRRSRPSAR
jgi:iron transport multicopper oxidase